jgi:hypothetical protein
MSAAGAHDNREIRIFLSSTFRDMEAERDYLLQHVFPRFRQDCAQRNVGFTEIDLRWGITEQASQNGLTVEICLSEIDRCREYPPFFIGFLGERYGWVPAAADLAAYWDAHSDQQYADAIRAALAQGISVTELEMRFGVLDHLHTPQASNAYFFLRAPALTGRLAQGAAPADFYDDGAGKLDALKQALRATGKVEIDGYDNVEAFGERIYQRLLQGLDQRYPLAQVPDELQQRAQEHARFAASRRHDYVPLPAMRAAVLAALQADAGRPQRHLYLSGPSGIGKSALMTDLAAWLPQQLPGAWVHARYSGADGSRELAQWRDDLLALLQPADGDDAAGSQGGDAERWQALLQALAQHGAAQPGPVILLLDAIDQLDDPGHALRTLAQQFWPPQVTLVVSGLPEYRPAHGYTVLAVPAPEAALRADIITAFTSGYRKALAPALVEYLSTAPAAASPLFLRMVLEELRVRSHHETLRADIDTLLACQQPDALFAHLLQRWDAAYSDAAHPAIASTLAGLLALSHAGLSEPELADLLAAPQDPVSPETGQPRLPAARLSPLLGVLRPYLLRNAGHESLMHQALQRGAQPAEPAVLRAALIRRFPQWHWRHVTERLFQRLQLARAAGAGSAEWAALEQELQSLATFFYLPRKARGLVRDSLQLMQAASAADDTPAMRIGRAWGEQLRHAGSRSWVQKARDWFQRQGSDDQMVTRMHWVNEMVGELIQWAYYGMALPLAEQAVALLEARGDEPGRLAAAYSNLALLNMERGRLDLAAAQFDRLKAFGRSHPAALRGDAAAYAINLANLYMQQGLNAQALPLAQEAVELTRQAVPYSAENATAAWQLLGTIQLNLGETARGVQTLEQAGAIAAQAWPSGHPAQLVLMTNLAQGYRQASRYDEAEALYRKTLAACRSILTPEHPVTAVCLTRLGSLYQYLQRLDEAEPLMCEALAMHRSAYGGAHREIVYDLIHLGDLYQQQYRYDASLACLLEALDMVRSSNASDRQALMRVLLVLSQCRLGQQAFADAERDALEALDIARADLTPQHPEYATALACLAQVYAKADAPQRAEALFQEVLALRRAILPAGHYDIIATLGDLGEVYATLMRPDLAEPLLAEALQGVQAISTRPLAGTGVLMMNLAATYVMQQRAEDAAALLRQAVALLRGTSGAGPEALGNALSMLSMVAAQLQRWDECLDSGSEALPVLRALGPAADERRFNCLQMLSQVPQAPTAALQWLEEALPLGRAQVPAMAERLSGMLQHASDLSLELGDKAAAQAYRDEDVATWRALAQGGEAAVLARLAQSLYWQGRLRLERGPAVPAIAPLEEALALLRAHGTDERMLMLVLSTLAKAYYGSQYKIGTAAALEREAGAIAARR